MDAKSLTPPSIIEVLTGTDRPRKYWNDLKSKLSSEGNQLSDKIGQLKMKSTDGKFYITDVADTEQLLRLIQSIPSPKAEPFKIWLAEVGSERIDEIADPELAIERALETYLKKGYTKEWIDQRLKTIEVRKELTDEWDRRGVKKGIEYAILTDEISKSWVGLTTKEYKNLKGLKKENLRDNMTNLSKSRIFPYSGSIMSIIHLDVSQMKWHLYSPKTQKPKMIISILGFLYCNEGRELARA